MGSGLRALRAAGAVAALFASTHACADVLLFSGQFRFGGPETVSIQSPVPPAPLEAGVGQFVFFNQTTNSLLYTYCGELAQTSVQSSTFLPSTLAASYSAPVATLIDKLFTSAYAGVSNAVGSAAFQLALWEVIADPQSLNLGSGVFQATSAATGVMTQANAMLAGLATAPIGGYSYTVWRSDTEQDQISVAAIPEPSTYALFLAGLGMLLSIAIRRLRA